MIGKNISSPISLKRSLEFLDKMIRAKKSLGQNFLVDQNIINKIVNILELKNKNILEIGPGTGNLTEGILRKNPKKF